MTALEFLTKLRKGGAIISAKQLDRLEVAEAKMDGQFFEDEQGFGYVWKSPEWLNTREKAFEKYADPVSPRIKGS